MPGLANTALAEGKPTFLFGERIHKKGFSRKASTGSGTGKELGHCLQAWTLKAGGKRESVLCHLLHTCKASADTLLNRDRLTHGISQQKDDPSCHPRLEKKEK